MAARRWLNDMVQDTRYAIRTLLKSPGFTVVAILTLALGIGANTAIFSVVDAVLLKPLPVRQPDRVVQLWETESAPGPYPLTGPDYLDWSSQNRTFSAMSLYGWPSEMSVSTSDAADGATVVRTQANFFDLLGVHPQIGRAFAKGEDEHGGSRVVLLSDAFWRSRFAARPEAIGRRLMVGGEPSTVIGVMPAWFRVPATADLWIPLNMDADQLGERGTHQYRAVGRLKDGVTLAQARDDLKGISERLEKQFPGSNRNVSAIVTPLRETVVGEVQTQLWIMFGAVGLVLLIACANVANLLLARSTGRKREIAVRGALGAGRWRLARQLITESLLLSFAGGLCGVVLAYSGVSFLKDVLPAGIPQPNPITVGTAPLLFALFTCVIVGVLFGVAPAVQSAAVDANDALKSRGALSAGASRRSHWLRNALVASEIALSLALLAGAGLLLRTFANLRATDVGVNPNGVLTALVRLPAVKYESLDQRREFYGQLLQRLRAEPGVRAAAVVSKLPLLGGTNGYITIPGQQEDSMTGPLVESTAFGGDYFEAMRIPLLAGRTFTAQDAELAAKLMREIAPAKDPSEIKAIAAKYVLPAVVNQTMAKTFWPNQNAIGKIFEHFATFEIVGVVGDVKQQSLRGPALPEAYYPLEWNLAEPGWPMAVVARTQGPAAALAAPMRSALRSMDDTLALMRVRPMQEIFSESMSDTRYEAWLLGLMAALALVLAAVGTYGVMAYVVGQRTNEIGIRMALGARPGQIMRLVLRQGGLIVGAGILLGLAGAAVSARFIASLLVGVKPMDPLTYLSVAALLAAVALVACLVPVRRAMAVDPMVALRDD